MLVAWWGREERARSHNLVQRGTYKIMSQALSVSKGGLVLVVVVAERGVGLLHEAKSYKLFPPI